MSYYDDSSLFLSPNGYKTSVLFAQKPMDANGQLAFTRSNDTATRVGPDGLIEKVRTQLLNQTAFSNAAWTKRGFTLNSSTATAPDGTATATQVTENNTDANPAVVVLTAPIYTNPTNFSVWIKASTATTIKLSTQGAVAGGNISVTTSWQKFSISQTVASAFGPHIGGFSSIAQGSGLVLFLWQPMWEFGDVATPFIENSTGSPLSVGPVANLPRIDYTGGGCGKLLLEPQRTNSLTYSEAFDNAAWSKTNLSVSANTTDTLDPSGYNGADKITDDTTNGAHQLFRFGIWSTTQQTLSIFAKAGTSSKVFIQNGSTGQGAYFDLSTESIVLGSGFTASIESYGNGWYRCIATHTASSSQTLLIGLFTGSSTTGYVGTGSYAYIWGAQIEAGAYPTSYIPTLGASVTRGADVVQKTSISSLIGQTEGVVFLDYTVTQAASSNSEFSISTGSNANAIRLRQSSGNFLQGVVQNGGVTQASIITTSSIVIGQRYKIAFAYANNDFAMYVNGELIGIDGSGSVPACSQIQNTNGGASSSADLAGAINQAILFKTRLSNSELAQLTTI